MIGILDEIGKTVVGKSQSAAEKAKNMAETVRLKGLISDVEKNINATYLQIGKRYYEIKDEVHDPFLIQRIAEINNSKANILKYNEQIKQLKGMVACAKCSTEIPHAAMFCGSCGSSKHAVPEGFVSTFCTQCGNPVVPGKAFCTKCGNKINIAGTEVPYSEEEPQDETYVVPAESQAEVQIASDTKPSFDIPIAPDVFATEFAESDASIALANTFCTQCGTTLALDKAFCTQCGHKVN